MVGLAAHETLKYIRTGVTGKQGWAGQILQSCVPRLGGNDGRQLQACRACAQLLEVR